MIQLSEVSDYKGEDPDASINLSSDELQATFTKVCFQLQDIKEEEDEGDTTFDLSF